MDGGKGSGAGGIDRHRRAAQAEDKGDASRDDTAESALQAIAVGSRVTPLQVGEIAVLSRAEKHAGGAVF